MSIRLAYPKYNVGNPIRIFRYYNNGPSIYGIQNLVWIRYGDAYILKMSEEGFNQAGMFTCPAYLLAIKCHRHLNGLDAL